MQLLSTFLFALMTLNLIGAETRNGISAQILAKRTGATQFEEERFVIHEDCNEHKRPVRSRGSDEDVDYEVYQGVVGRPGIDFPIYPRIPKTSFSCRAYGNGYFADMETDCQVFHICEEGRKISFLCPNGTIFQQSELTCDWWFKVNCLGSSGYYADSTELLNKQRIQRLKPSVPVKGFNILGGSLNIKPRLHGKLITDRTHIVSKSERRIDSDETPSLESIDFDDLSAEKQSNEPNKQVLTDVENNDNDNESQIAAESSSFVNNHNRNDYAYDKSNAHASKISHSKKAITERGMQRHIYLGNHFNNESMERARKGQRGSQRYREDSKASSYSIKRLDSESINKSEHANGGHTFNKKFERNFSNPTPAYFAGTYTTARRLESSRNTPFYTPTVPTVLKSKSSENKSHYYKINPTITSISHRFNLNPSNFPPFQVFSESSAVPKLTTTATDAEINGSTTQRNIIIGMRHNNHDQNIIEFPKATVHPSKKITMLHNSGHTTETAVSTTRGPTYLPNGFSLSKKSHGASGDLLLYAPIPVIENVVARNLNDMLKTMNILKNKLNDVEVIKVGSKGRTGLDIPPSSGPDALLSLAHYFATERNDVSEYKFNSLKEITLENNSHALSSRTAEGKKPSDITATLTTEATVSVKTDDIKSGLLSDKTVDKYSTLFGLNNTNAKEKVFDSSEGLLSNVNVNENTKTNVTVTSFPQVGATDATLKVLVSKPETRKIAQVFSNALSSYLDDPLAFREQLEAARPTEPPPIRKAYLNYVTTIDEGIFDSSTIASYSPTKNFLNAQTQQTTEAPSIAIEINSNFDPTTRFPDLTSTTEFLEVTTFKSSPDRKNSLEFSAELELLSPESGEGDEFLQREQTQSFAKPLNQLIKSKIKKETRLKTADNTWNSLTENDYVNPLVINDGLMKERKSKSTTISPDIYLLNSGTRSNEAWKEIFETYNIPRESLPSSSGLQRIANKLFGGLNESEALHLKNVMAQAEHNRQVLSLLLLLIQTCDDKDGKALERSRKHLLNALIEMDGKLINNESGETSHHKQTFTTTEKFPVTTFRRTGSGEEITTSTITYPSTTSEVTSTTNSLITTLSPVAESTEQTTKFEIRVGDLEEGDNITAASTNSEESSDRRALELLKSLYSLASKFTSRR